MVSSDNKELAVCIAMVAVALGLMVWIVAQLNH